MILFFENENNQHLLFKDVTALKGFVKTCGLDTYKDNNGKHIIDPSVYREGLFRTIHSSKLNENRPFVKSPLSDDFSDIESFVSWYTKFEKSHTKFRKVPQN